MPPLNGWAAHDSRTLVAQPTTPARIMRIIAGASELSQGFLRQYFAARIRVRNFFRVCAHGRKEPRINTDVRQWILLC